MTTLRDALHENIHESSVPIKQIADFMAISYSYLANAGNPNMEDGPHFQLKHLIPLTKATGNFSALDYVERAVGRVAFVVPSIGADVSEVITELSSVTQGFSHLLLEMSKALEDKKIRLNEIPGIKRECEHLIRNVCRLLAAAKQEAAK